MFRGGEADIQLISAHNVHENIGRFQEVGTSMLLYGPLVDQYDFPWNCHGNMYMIVYRQHMKNENTSWSMVIVTGRSI